MNVWARTVNRILIGSFIVKNCCVRHLQFFEDFAVDFLWEERRHTYVQCVSRKIDSSCMPPRLEQIYRSMWAD